MPSRLRKTDDSALVPIDDASPPPDSIDQLRAALDLARQNNETDRQLEILKAIGKAQISQGYESEAVAAYSEILAIY